MNYKLCIYMRFGDANVHKILKNQSNFNKKVFSNE